MREQTGKQHRAQHAQADPGASMPPQDRQSGKKCQKEN